MTLPPLAAVSFQRKASPSPSFASVASQGREEEQEDVLTEGQHYLSISMLVYMYSHLRETCRMGHTHVKMEDIDVHSHQRHYQDRAPGGAAGPATRYLDKAGTQTAGSVIRVLIDELERGDAEDDDAERDIVGNENQRYERR